MARTKQTARVSTGGAAPRKQLLGNADGEAQTNHPENVSKRPLLVKKQSTCKSTLARAPTLTLGSATSSTLTRLTHLSKTRSLIKVSSVVSTKLPSQRSSKRVLLKNTTASGYTGSTSANRKRKESSRVQHIPAKKAKLAGDGNDASATTKHKTKRKSKLKVDEDDDDCLYLRGEYVAVRNDLDGFYLCRCCQNIYKHSKALKVYWLDIVKENIYKFEYVDIIPNDYTCIITHVHLKKVAKNTYELSENEKSKINAKLEKALNGNQDIDSGSEEKSITDKKQRRIKPTNRQNNASKPSDVKKSSRKSKPQTKVPLRKMTTAEKKNPNLLLKPRASMKVIYKDPLLDSSEKMPFVSTVSYSKLIFRAVHQKDQALLKTLISDSKRVSVLNSCHSVGWYITPIQLAILQNNMDALQELVNELQTKQYDRAQVTVSRLAKLATGEYNKRSLGISRIRKLMASRGSKEGNNALLKITDSNSEFLNDNHLIKYAIRSGISAKSLDKIMKIVGGKNIENMERKAVGCIYETVTFGNRKLAAELMKRHKKIEFMSGFNNLHILACEADDPEDLKTFRAVSVHKKPNDNFQVTPLHCAAINPNAKIIAKLLSVAPDINVNDARQRKPVHFAAACEGTGPLELLLKRGANATEVDGMTMSPLHIACETGRVENVQIFLKKAAEVTAKSVDEDDDDNQIELEKERYGIGGVNRPVTKPQHRRFYSFCSIHIAIDKRHKDIVEVLLKHGADVNKELGTSKHKLTPLMMAAASGQLDICELLVKYQALIDMKDRLGRTALIHAAMSGHTHVASYLISLGANLNAADSSKNTVVHYAGAYGWYFTLRLLIDCKANLDLPNSWNLTPLAVTFLKGHLGLADLLLQQPGVNINVTDDNGRTLVSMACASYLDKDLPEQIRYLLLDMKADATIKDANGNTAMHYLAVNTTAQGALADKVSIEIAKLLLQHGVSANDANHENITPVIAAVQEGKLDMVNLLLESGGTVTTVLDADHCNILHHMADRCMKQDFTELLHILQKNTSRDNLQVMAKQVNCMGFTPLLWACKVYHSWDGYVTLNQENDVKDSSHHESEEDENNEDDEKSENQDDNSSEIQDDQEEIGVDQDGNETGSDEEMDNDTESGKSDEDDEEDSHKGKKTSSKSTLTGDTATKYAKARNHQLAVSRKFIEFLITVCDSDVNFVNQKKIEKNEFLGNVLFTSNRQRFIQPSEKKEKDYYAFPEAAKWTSLWYMVAPKAELYQETPDTAQGLKLLLKHKANPNVKDLSGKPLLHHAILKFSDDDNCDCTVDLLIRYGADVNCQTDDEKSGHISALLLAVAQKNSTVAEKLLSNGANIQMKDDRDQTSALHKAAVLLDVEMIILLVKHKALINEGSHRQRTPLHMAVNALSGAADSSSESVQILIDNGADVWAKDEYMRMPLFYAFEKIGKHKDTSHIDPIELCMTLTAAMRGREVDSTDMFGQTPLHRAALRGASVCCVHLLQKGATINRKDLNGNTALAMTVFEKHESCTLMLLQNCPDINITVNIPEASDNHDPNKKQNWKWAPIPSKTNLQAKAYPIFQNVIRNNWQGVTYVMLDMFPKHGIPYGHAIEAAFVVKKLTLALTLIIRAKVDDLQFTNSDKRNLLHLLALSGSLDDNKLLIRVCNVLLEKKVQPQATDVYGCTPLIYAALSNSSAIISILIDNVPGLNIDHRDGFKRTALDASLWNDNMECFECLASAKASVDSSSSFPEITPAMFGVPPKVDYFDKSAKLMTCTPLTWMVCKQNFTMVQRLINDYHCSLNYRDVENMTPFMHAVRLNDKHLMKILLDNTYDQKEEEKKAIQAIRDKMNNIKKAGASKPSQAIVFQLKKQQSSKNDLALKKAVDKKESKSEKPLDPEDLTQFTSFVKKSTVDVNAKDNRGWTAIHYLVAPMDVGTFDNLEIFKLLVDVGVELDAVDNAGLTALDYALIRGAPKLTRALQRAMKRPNEQWEEPTYQHVTVHSCLEGMANFQYDFKQDAECLVTNEQSMDETNKQQEWKPQPDPLLSLDKGTGEVLKDTNLDTYYDVLLTKVDVAKGAWGLYNFYKMQVVLQKGRNVYILFTCWGRIGDDGQYQRSPYPTLEEAIKEFSKIFRAKTGNKWTDIAKFEVKPYKYRLVDISERQLMPKMKGVSLDFTTPVNSKLPVDVQEMFKEWTDHTALKNVMETMCVDTEQLPYGSIKKDTLQKALEVLKQIKNLIVHIAMFKNKESKTDDDLEKYRNDFAKVCSLTNEYYHLVPQKGYEYERIKPIDSDERLKQEWKNINTLLDLQLSAKIMAGAHARRNEMNPLDYVYMSLKCNIEVMEERDVDSQYLLKYISNTQGAAKIEAIYRVSRPTEEAELMWSNINNHMLLFHGTSSFNMLGILYQGLQIAPPEAPAAGFAFGKGIYFSDKFSKSSNYCRNFATRTGSQQPVFFMLICQVAIGKACKRFTPEYCEKAPDGFNSVQAIGNSFPDPSKTITLPTGAKIPLGPIITDPLGYHWNEEKNQYICAYVPDNEYVVYSENQVCIRYIIQYRPK